MANMEGPALPKVPYMGVVIIVIMKGDRLTDKQIRLGSTDTIDNRTLLYKPYRNIP